MKKKKKKEKEKKKLRCQRKEIPTQ
jgi:hypothetical protein